MESKKGQGLPLNTIVIAAIVLIVMVVLIYIFVGGMGQTTEKLQSCTEKGGTCMMNAECAGQNIGTLDCGTGEICCVPIPT